MNTNPSVHVAVITKTVRGKTYKSVLLRRTYREGGKVKHETLGTLSALPPDVIEYIRKRLAGDLDEGELPDSFEIVRSLPHGNVVAILQTLCSLGLDNIIASRRSRERDLVMAMIVSRLIAPKSKLSTCTALQQETAKSTLGEELELGELEPDEFYQAMDWLLKRQKRIENKLAKRHLQDGSLVLYDVSSSYYTGCKSSLIQHGYSRDHRRDCPQIVYGLLCDSEGRPVAVEVFSGNTADPTTFTSIVQTVRKRFAMQRVIFVGDRGMITSARIREDLREVEGLDWISALRSDGIKKLIAAGLVQRSLFDEQELAEIVSEDFPGERLVVCRNPILAAERARKREALLRATEVDLQRIREATLRQRNPLRTAAEIGLRVGKVIGKHKMNKHFDLTIEDDRFTFARNEENIKAETLLDGLYVVRTSLPEETMSAGRVVETYKSLAKVERAFRSLKTVDLQIRPIYHRKNDRIRSHVFLCMLSYYVEWHMRQKLQTVLFNDCEKQSVESSRRSPVSPAARSESARGKDASRRTLEGHPVQSFQDVLKDLATLTRNRISVGAFGCEYDKVTSPTAYQRHVLALLRATV